MDTPSTSIGPGLGAFIAFFVLAVSLWLLMRNMNGRMRRMAYKEQQRVADLEEREAERAAPNNAAKGAAKGAPKRAAASPTQDAEDKADPAP